MLRSISTAQYSTSGLPIHLAPSVPLDSTSADHYARLYTKFTYLFDALLSELK